MDESVANNDKFFPFGIGKKEEDIFGDYFKNPLQAYRGLCNKFVEISFKNGGPQSAGFLKEIRLDAVVLNPVFRGETDGNGNIIYDLYDMESVINRDVISKICQTTEETIRAYKRVEKINKDLEKKIIDDKIL